MHTKNVTNSGEAPESGETQLTPRLREENYQKKPAFLSGRMRQLVVALGLAGVMVGAARTDMAKAKKDEIVGDISDASVVGNRISKNVRRMLLSKDALDKLEESERQEYMTQRFEELMIICSAIENLQMKLDELRNIEASLQEGDRSITPEHTLDVENAMTGCAFVINECLVTQSGENEDPFLPLTLSVVGEASQSLKASSEKLIIPKVSDEWKKYIEQLEARITDLGNENKSVTDNSSQELAIMFDAYRSSAPRKRGNASSQEAGDISLLSRTGIKQAQRADPSRLTGYFNEVKRIARQIRGN